MQEPKMVNIDDIKFVGICTDHNVHKTAKGDSAIPSLIKDFDLRVTEIQNQKTNFLGISGPIREEGVSNFTAAVEVTDLRDLPKNMVAGIIPAGAYLEFTHIGPISTFHKTVSFIHNTWMPKAGYLNHDCSQIEIMSMSDDVNALDFEMKVLVSPNGHSLKSK